MISHTKLCHGDKPEVIFLIQICMGDHFAWPRILSPSLEQRASACHGCPQNEQEASFCPLLLPRNHSFQCRGRDPFCHSTSLNTLGRYSTNTRLPFGILYLDRVNHHVSARRGKNLSWAGYLAGCLSVEHNLRNNTRMLLLLPDEERFMF